MASRLRELDVRVSVMERNFYARQTLVSYLGQDRRTRVVYSADSPFRLLRALVQTPQPSPDVILFDASCARGDPDKLTGWLWALRPYASGARVLCLAQSPDLDLALAAGHAGAAGFLTRDAVGYSVGWAVIRALDADFLVTEDVAVRLNGDGAHSLFQAEVLPPRRHYPSLTERVEQALYLCVLEGLPASLAADEMGLSTSTVRSYIKEGYRILETHDDTIYPTELSPQERAFLRYTAIEAA